MLTRWRAFVAKTQRIWRLFVLFIVLRLLAGLAMVVFDRDALAWGWQATVIVLGALAVYFVVALALRRGSAAAG